jgi:hypothetical protein
MDDGENKRVEHIALPFLTSALDGGEGSVLHPQRFTPRKITPSTRWIGG